MRRPLLGTGIPKSVLAADGVVTLLDTSALDPTQVYAVTLFAWPWTAVTPATAEPSLAVTLDSDGVGGPAVSGVLAAFFTAWKATIAPQVGVPLKILDRLMVRGNQQLKIANAGADGNSCFIWGYFEAIGDEQAPMAYRPLQPLTPPVPAADGSFSPAPTLVFPAGPNSNEYATAHQLSNKLIDLLTLHVDFVTGLAYGGTLAAFVRFPGNVKVPLPWPAPAAAASNAIITPFDGIPMRALTANAVNVEIGFDDSGNPGSAALSAYGDFYRY